LNYIRFNLYEKEKNDKNLLITSSKYNLNSDYIKKFSKIVKEFFILKDKVKDKIIGDSRHEVLLKDYDYFYKKYIEYFLALSSYEEYKLKYDKQEKELNSYNINQEEKVL
jgi:hypothetical protein